MEYRKHHPNGEVANQRGLAVFAVPHQEVLLGAPAADEDAGQAFGQRTLGLAAVGGWLRQGKKLASRDFSTASNAEEAAISVRTSKT